MLAHFNTSYVVIKLELSTPLLKCFTISIHLMLLLNTGASVKLDLSTGDFNTSYVVIKLNKVVLILLPLSDFNTSYVVIKLDIRPLRPEQNNYFNTSYVVIKP